MMRKVLPLLLGTVLGAGLVTLATKTQVFPEGTARAAASDTYRNLNLFGDVFEKIRSDYVEKPDEQKLVEAAINGMLNSLDRIRATWTPRASATCRFRRAANSAVLASR